jgi:hypothetical protein
MLTQFAAVWYQLNSMKIPVVVWRVLALCMLALAFGISVYRARVQAIGHDEAEEYEWFLDGGVYHVLSYNPANHVLFTLLAKPIVWALGVSEFTLRAPSVIGTVLYLIAIYLLCRRLFVDGVLLFFSVAMLCLNPQILDFMSAARGYILGLGCLSAGMYILALLANRGKFQPDDKWWRRGCAIASMFFALSVTTNFTNVVPSAALMICFAVVALGSFSALVKFRDRTLRIFAQYLVVPGIAVGFCILWPYLLQARLGHFKINMGRASDALGDTFAASFLYKWTDDIYAASISAVPPSPGSWQQIVLNLGIYILLPSLFLFVLLGLILISCARSESTRNQTIYCWIFGGSAIASVALIVLLHVGAKLDYPLSRYCLFVIPLFTISSLLVGREFSLRFPRLHLRVAGLTLAAIVICDYGLSLQTKYFRYQAYDVISRELYQTIANDARSRGLQNVRVGGTWWYEPEINFYRRRYNAAWMKPYDVKDRSYFWESPNSLSPGDYDYYVFTPANDPGLENPRAKRIFQDRATHLTVLTIENRLPRANPCENAMSTQ